VSGRVEQYRLKSKGPRMEPWETPKRIAIEEERESPILTR
jgi:hypothetical protein